MPLDVIMPALGMAQDSGLIVAWHKHPGDAVAEGDVLFEVETDKATVEVEAQGAGYLTEVAAAAGAEVPVGQVIARIGDIADTPGPPPAAPVAHSAAARVDDTEAAPAPEPPRPAPADEPKETHPTPPASGRVLASPKARRLALEQGLDLSRLAAAGYPQPYHASDIETLRSLTLPHPAPAADAAPCQITARAGTAAQDDFLRWCAAETDAPPQAGALWAAFAAAALREATGEAGALTVELSPLHGPARLFTDPDRARLSALDSTEPGPPPRLRLRDLSGDPVTGIRLGAPPCPVLTVADGAKGFALTLDFTAAQLDEAAAISLLTGFAQRLDEPLRHLL